MDEQQLTEMASSMLPQPEDIGKLVKEQLDALLPEMVKAIISEHIAAGANAKPELDSADEEKVVMAPEEEKVDNALSEEELNRRMDARIEAVRVYEKFTGKSDFKGKSDFDLIKAAAAAAGVAVRTDASADRILGTLEGIGSATRTGVKVDNKSNGEEITFVPHEERMATRLRAMNGGKV